MKKSMLCFIILLINSTVYSQNLQFFNVDASAFPNVKANFYAFDAAWNQQSPDKSALGIKENGLTRYIVNVTCPTPKTPTVLSSVLVMDISNSTNGKNIGIAKIAAQAWVNALPNDKSECALISFDHFNYFNQDFANDKNKLLTAINNLVSGDGTDYNKALIDTMCGGLIASKTGKYQKVLVLLTDGLSSSITDVSKIVTEAKLQNCKIFVIALDMKCPNDLQDITNQTGGQWFENVATESKAAEIFHLILKIAQGSEPCSVLWRSDANCDTTNVNIELVWNGQKATNVYPTPANAIHKLEVSPATIIFGPVDPGKSIDTTIKIKAIGIDIKITAINLKYGSTAFQIKDVAFPLTIPKNTSYNLTIRYTPTDSNLCYGGFEIETDYCSSYFSCIGGFLGKPINPQTLKLTHPNGGETFYTNSDTLIAWDGVVPSDAVTLEFSDDNGVTWNPITDKATGLKYIWKNIPKTKKDKCLIRVSLLDYGRSVAIDWQKSFGGTNEDQAECIQQTKDGGYVVAGMSYSNDGDMTGCKGGNDAWVIKLNNLGSIEWEKNYGGTLGDWALSIRQTADDGYVFAGYTTSNDGDVSGYKGSTDFWVVKLNSTGSIVWQKALGGTGYDVAYDIQQTKDGGYVVAGGTSSNNGDVSGNKGGTDFWVVKLSVTGSLEWQKTLGGSLNDNYANSIQQTTDGGYVVCGGTTSEDGDVSGGSGGGFWVIKLNSTGSIVWQKTLGGGAATRANSIIQTTDAGYIVCGEVISNGGEITGFHGEYDVWVVKLNSSGIIEWQKTYGGSHAEFVNNINLTKEGGYVFACVSNSNDGDVTLNYGAQDFWLVKLKSDGRMEWQKSIGGSSLDIPESIQQTTDNGYIVAGNSSSKDHDVTQNKGKSDFWIVKLRLQGDIIQTDQSDAVFSLVEQKVVVNDFDMIRCLLFETKDSTISYFIENKGMANINADSIYFRGTDAVAFSLVSSLPSYKILPNTWHSAELRFAPKRVGIHKAEIVIITQSDTLVRNITGEGIAPQISIESKIVDFGKVNVGDNRDSLQVLTIKNISKKSLAITNTIINGPNLTDFSTISTVSNFTLKPDETKKIDLRFKPSDIGRTSGILAFYYDGVGSPVEVQLYGECVMETTQDLSSPANGTINVPIDWKLIWEPNTAYNSYNLQVSKDENFSDITIDTTTKLTYYKLIDLEFMHTYFWRVKAIMGSEQTNWSSVWKFTTLMDTVKLTSPIDLSKNQNIPLNLTWDEGIYKKDYRLQISETDDFATTKTDTLISKNANADVKNLNYWQPYFWRVRNESGDTLGYWSKIWQFKTRLGDALLVYPADTQTGLAQEINFKWNSVSGAEFYQLQISKNEQFTDLVYSRDSIQKTSQFVPNLESQMLYYWRVRVWNSETIGTAYWSEVWTFKTGGTGLKDETDVIQIIPNPAGDFITVTLGTINPMLKHGVDETAIYIYNILGEKVMSASARHAVPLRINISDLPKGMYFVKVGGETKKFIKL